LEAVFILLEPASPSRRFFYRLPFTPSSLVCCIGPSASSPAYRPTRAAPSSTRATAEGPVRRILGRRPLDAPWLPAPGAPRQSPLALVRLAIGDHAKGISRNGSASCARNGCHSSSHDVGPSFGRDVWGVGRLPGAREGGREGIASKKRSTYLARGEEFLASAMDGGGG
jgi:hypothetical protein